jgi:hypothetical protein
MIRRRMALHSLAHNVSVYAWAFLPGIVERLKDAVYFLLIQLPVKFRKAGIKAYKKRAFYAIDGKVHESTPRRIATQFAFKTKSLIVSVFYFSIGPY